MDLLGCKVIPSFPKPTQIPNTGGNLAGTTMIVFLRGIITRNQSETDESFATIPLILEIAKSYDGIFDYEKSVVIY
ncbi:Chondroitin_AC/alginate lyase [Hexamita inflata]|uniref:Chondroitin AC/alginate lyase n=1 Tax=Hexamita inflata TaxID=28002 RepID=A0AA86R643_9EUKA|nr:Chondroitin AC/alginate lyase [Hexamita inflata]